MTPRTTFAGQSPFIGLMAWKAAQCQPQEIKPNPSRRPAAMPTMGDKITAWMSGQGPVTMIEIVVATGYAFATVHNAITTMWRYGEISREPVETHGKRVFWRYALTGKSTRFKVGPKTRRLFTDQQVAGVRLMRSKGATMAEVAKEFGCAEGLIRDVLKMRNELPGVRNKRQHQGHTPAVRRCDAAEICLRFRPQVEDH